MHKIEEHIISGFISGGLKAFATHGLSVNEGSFSDNRCKKLFTRIKALSAKNRFFDLVVLSEEFRGDDDITPEYLVELSGLETFSFELPSMLQSHLDQLFKQNLRKMVGGFKDKIPEDIITELQATIWGYHSGRNFDWNLGDKLRETLEWIEEKGKGVIEYPFGLTAVDNLLGGLFRKELTVLAARPSCGKTSLAINLANNLINEGKKVLYIDLESGELSLLERFLSYRTRISGHRIHRGEVAQSEIQKLTKAASEMNKLPLVINDQSGMTVGEINNQALCIGAECVIVDYLNLVGGGDPTNEVDRLGEITLGLHHMAKNLNIPVVLLAQLNRGVDHREDHRPRMSDLRGSGKIEEPADNILFLYWAYKYDSEKLENVNELIVGKQRNGPIGAEQLSWQASHFAFGDLFKGEEDSGKRSESNAGSNNGVKQGDSSPKRKWARPLHQSAFGFGDAPEHGGGDAEHLLGRAPLEERRAVARLRGDISDNEGSDS